MKRQLIHINLLRNQHAFFFCIKKVREESQAVVQGLRKEQNWSYTLIDWLGGGLGGVTHSFSSMVWVLFCVSVCP